MKILKVFEKWCKETGRSGGVLVGSSIREFFRYYEPEEVKEENKEVLVGTLNKAFGIIGYDIAKVGHPVYDDGQRYIIYLTHPTLPVNRVPFYKEDLTVILNKKK
jgi:hypothetical protein